MNFIENSLNLLDLIMDANCSINEVPIFIYDNVRGMIFFRHPLLYFNFKSSFGLKTLNCFRFLCYHKHIQ